MSADLTCPTCRGSMTKFNQRMGPLGAFVHRAPCPDCTDGRRRPELHEWDALKDERDSIHEIAAAAIRERDALKAERDRAKEAVRNIDKALRNAVKERNDALDGRDRYREALESIRVRCCEGDRRTDWLPVIDSIARAALDSPPAGLDTRHEGGDRPGRSVVAETTGAHEPDLTERTRRIRADE